MLCVFSGCENIRKTNLKTGYCHSHQSQWYKVGKDDSKLTSIRYRTKDTNIVGLKVCRMCLETKDTKHFHLRSSSPDGKSLYCKTCEKAKKVRNTYGISIEEVIEKLQNQKGLCMICENDITDRWCVDHNHETGKIRGLLCDPCNLMIGLAKDNVIVLDNAINYLQRWS